MVTNPDWWRSKRSEYPRHCAAPVSVRPEKVPGDHVSTGYIEGWRIWGFRDPDAQSKFLVDHPSAVRLN